MGRGCLFGQGLLNWAGGLIMQNMVKLCYYVIRYSRTAWLHFDDERAFHCHIRTDCMHNKILYCGHNMYLFECHGMLSIQHVNLNSGFNKSLVYIIISKSCSIYHLILLILHLWQIWCVANVRHT